MKKAIKYFILALVAAAIGAYAYITVNAPLPVKLTLVEPKEAYVYFTETGTVRGGKDVCVYPAISGDVLHVYVKTDQRVHKDDIIAWLDPREFVAERNLIEANIRSIEANIQTIISEDQVRKDGYRDAIAELEAQLNTIEAQRLSASAERLYTDTLDDQVSVLELSISQAELERSFWDDRLKTTESLYESGAATRQEVADAERRVTDIDNQIAQFREQIESAKNESAKASQKSSQVSQSANRYYEALTAAARSKIATLEANIDKDYVEAQIKYYITLIDAENERIKTVDDNMNRRVIRSPADGYIKELGAETLTRLTPQTCAAIIAENSERLLVDSYVNTKDISSVGVGDAVELKLKSRDGDRMFGGVVTEIDDKAESRISALGIEEKRVKLTIAVDGGSNDDGNENGDSMGGEAADILYPGYDVEVRYTVYREQGALMVPTGALFKQDGADCVFILEDDKAVSKPVTTGPKTSIETVITDGLAVGDVVVADADTEGLTDGKRITAAQ